LLQDWELQYLNTPPNNVKMMKRRRLCWNVGKECVLNFGKEAPWKALTWKTEKEMEG
jgi:hypothetical protein